MEVTVGGVAVANGSTLSTTGEMQVTCNAPYVLSVDGVVWTPTASAGGVDSYLLSTSGVVRIFINGTRYFIFTNVVSADFSFGNMDIYERSGGVLVAERYGLNKYFQGNMIEGSDELIMDIHVDSVSPSMTTEELIALGANSTQGNSVASSPSEGYARVTVTNFDTSVYNAIFLGNVLLAFFEPAE